MDSILYGFFFLQQIPCDINKRTDSCPVGHCCARDEFLPGYVVCKKIGKIRSSCATVPDDSVCPCDSGLKCIPNVNSKDFVSIYGTCQPNITTVATTISTTTRPTTTTTLPVTTVEHNHPPLIRLKDNKINVSKKSKTDQSVTTFTVIDDDKGSNGQVKCSVLQPPFFRIKKLDDNTFNMVVASSLRTLSPQTVLTILICEDGGNPKLNGVAQLSIQIVLENHSHASSTMSTTATKMASSPAPMTKVHSHASSTMSTTAIKMASSPAPMTKDTPVSTSSNYPTKMASETSTRRSLFSVTFN